MSRVTEEDDLYYVIRIPYNDAGGGVAEFWRKETLFQVPANYSTKEVGFPDRRYTWTVQVMQCTAQCDKVLDDNTRKEGIEVSNKSAEGVFYWHPDIGGGTEPTPRPTPTPA